MSITTYSELETAVASWMARDDLTSNIPDFITLFEAEANRRLRTRQMLVTQTTTPSSGQFSLPSDFLGHVYLRWTGTPFRDLEYVYPTQFSNLYPDNPAATPQIFTILGTTDNVGIVKFTPSDTTALSFTYYAKITALSTANTSNWLLTAHPDAYLFGSLVEGNIFAKDPDTAAVWKQRRDDVFDSIIKLDQKYRAPSAIRPLGMTP